MNNQGNKDKNSKSKKNIKKERPGIVSDAAEQLRSINQGDTPSDTMGSYTGTAYDGGKPEQDADDL